MIGAIIGDVVGSRFEWHNIHTKEFELLTKDSEFTDDTVLTIALMDWICHGEKMDHKEAATYLQKWARKYPRSGYGGRFRKWIYEEKPEPYNSFGNGSAMRISALPWMIDEEEDLETAVLAATACTHNHPEGIKGAMVTAKCIYKALHGATKEEIKKYAISEYPEIATLDYETLKRTYVFNETCQESVPQAIYCFLISKDFEDCLRTTISIGGDSDTLAAISCAIAEAFYGDIPFSLRSGVENKLTNEMLEIIKDANFIRNMK